MILYLLFGSTFSFNCFDTNIQYFIHSFIHSGLYGLTHNSTTSNGPFAHHTLHTAHITLEPFSNSFCTGHFTYFAHYHVYNIYKLYLTYLSAFHPIHCILYRSVFIPNFCIYPYFQFHRSLFIVYFFSLYLSFSLHLS